jgi:hypothetical protein
MLEKLFRALFEKDYRSVEPEVPLEQTCFVHDIESRME